MPSGAKTQDEKDRDFFKKKMERIASTTTSTTFKRPESRSTAGMKRGHVWTAFVFALVVFVKMIASADVMTRGLDFQGKVLREGMVIDSEQEAALPDISDPAIRKELKCQLCQGVVMEMLQTIRGQEHELLRRLTEVEVVETLEKICSQVL